MKRITNQLTNIYIKLVNFTMNALNAFQLFIKRYTHIAQTPPK